MDHSDFFSYLLQSAESDTEKLPALKDLSLEMGISISTLREQLEVAKALGLVDVKPRLGIRHLPYSFTPAVDATLCYAIQHDQSYFDDYVDLRRHLEISYFPMAVDLLNESDHLELRRLIKNAWEKLQGSPVRIPHQEHRELHMTFYKRLNNVFVSGLLEAYWDAYEAVGLNVYADLDYLEQVWTYHDQLADAAINRNKERGLEILREHFNLMDRMIR
jgi:DNA-binding FadR family transcriptional regulator